VLRPPAQQQPHDRIPRDPATLERAGAGVRPVLELLVSDHLLVPAPIHEAERRTLRIGRGDLRDEVADVHHFGLGGCHH
jgi:hypothetical protein